MRHDEFCAVMGFFVGVALMLGLSLLPSATHRIYMEAKAECEKPLPRDQHCKIIAVPEVMK